MKVFSTWLILFPMAFCILCAGFENESAIREGRDPGRTDMRTDVRISGRLVLNSLGWKKSFIVFPFECKAANPDEIIPGENRVIVESRNREKVEFALTAARIAVLERTRVDSLLKEISFSKTGLTDQNRSEIGKLTNADYAILGSVVDYRTSKTSRGNRFYAEIIVKAVEIQTGAIVWEADLKGNANQLDGSETPVEIEDALYDYLSDILAEKVKQIERNPTLSEYAW